MILIVKHIEIEGPGLIGDFFKGNGYDLKTVELENGEHLPEGFEDIEAVVVLGGPMNVYDEDNYPYLKNENEFIKNVIIKEIPFMGICLGAQLLAKASGAKVKRSPVEEIGFFSVELTEQGLNDILFEGLEKKLQVFQWHGDTFTIPGDAFHLAQSEGCRNQAFRIGKNAYGLQFHLEILGDTISDWCKEYFDSGDNILKQKAREMVQRHSELKDDLKKNTYTMCSNFDRLIQSYNLVNNPNT